MTTYTVSAYEGDYCMDGQPNWAIQHHTLGEAIEEAFNRWRWLLNRCKVEAAQAVERQLCVVVDHGDGVDRPDFIIGTPCEDLV